MSEKNPCIEYIQTWLNLGLKNLLLECLLAHGKTFETQEHPKNNTMQAKQCFRNAGMMAMERPDLYTYCEGYAMVHNLFPMEHAWLVDHQGRVIDPTWEYHPNNVYFGVMIDAEKLQERLMEKQTWGFFGEMHDKKLFESNSGGVKPEWII